MPEQKTIPTEPIVDKTYMYVRVKNNTSAVQNIVLFDVAGAYNAQNAINGTTTYSVDMTADLAAAITKGLHTVTVLAISPGQTGYQLYTVNNAGNLPFQNIDQVVTALNNLSIGIFFVVAGNTIAVQGRGYTFSNISITSLLTAQHDTNTYGTNFTTGGSLIYDPGYSLDLKGNFNQISLANAFWKNTFGSFNGPYNRCNVYANNPDNVELSLFGNFNAAQSKTVYIGISFSKNTGTNQSSFAQLYLNNVKLINVTTNSELNGIASNVNTILGTAYTGSEITYICWHIIPVVLQAGNNVVQLVSKSNVTAAINFMGLEVYDNTSAEIQAATSYSELNVLFSGIQYSGKSLF